MKALVITDKNTPLVVQELADLKAGPGEAIVRIHAASLNHRDVWIQKGQYSGLKYPIVPGSDGAGVVVEAVKDQNASTLGDWTGKEVIINPSMLWGQTSAYQDQKNFRILGLPDNGTLAEYVKVPIGNLVEKPAHLSFEEAAALPLAGVTAYRAAMTRAKVQAGEKVLITGIGGGVALFAFQFALAAGALIYVTSGSDEKLDKATEMGAKGAVNYNNADWVRRLREQAGDFDVTIDGAGGDGINDLLDLAAPGSRIVLYGATRGNPSNLVARRIFWKQLNVLGSTMGSPDDFEAMAGFIRQHTIRPVVDRVFGFEEAEAAFRWMEGEKQFGKIVVKI
jgi:zinc-binding alcohol dehydrogenase/oxidoreductase